MQRVKGTLRPMAWILGLCVVLPSSAQTLFTYLGAYGIAPSQLAIVDVDADGNLDVFACGGNGCALVHNEGTNGFQQIITDLDVVPATAMAWGDWDRDGLPDVALVESGGTRIYRNLGGGHFELVDPGVQLPAGSSVQWGDFDQDGALDLLISGSGATYVFRNVGNDRFKDSGLRLPASLIPNGAQWVDYDGNGTLDIAVAGYLPGTWGPPGGLLLFDNTGAGQYASAYDVGLGLVYRLIWLDLDLDGKMDLYWRGPFPAAGVDLFSQTGPKQFTEFSQLFWSHYAPQTEAFVDFDNDGFLEFFVFTQYDYTFIFKWDGQEMAGDAPEFEAPMMWVGVNAWGDLDNDGALDLVAWATFAQSFGIFHNETPRKNSPPGMPSGLQAQLLERTARGSHIRLEWLPAIDPDQASGLTYAVRVGSTPGGIEIEAPHARLSDGRRLLPERGNASAATHHDLFLPSGSFTWSVQAVDRAWAGSPFPPESTFTIPTAAPVAETGDVRDIQPGTAVLQGKVNPNGLASLAWFEFGLTTNYGNLTAATNINPDLASAEQALLARGLPLSERIHYRLVASNQAGIYIADDRQFDTYNTPPLLGQPADIIVYPGRTIPPVVLQVNDAESPDEIQVVASVSNTNFLAPGLVVVKGSGTNWTLTITPPPGVVGSSWIALTATDRSRLSTQVSFRVTVEPFTALRAPFAAVNDVQVGDLDNDGLPDLVVSSGYVLLQRGVGNMQFASPVQLGARSVTVAVALTDLNNDGLLDVLAIPSPGSESNAVAYINQGNWVFTTNRLSGVPALSYAAVAVADFDRDGHPDFCVMGYTNRFGLGPAFTAVFRQDGPMSFARVDGLDLPQLAEGTVEWVDWNNDGYPDLFLSGLNPGTQQRVSRLYVNQQGRGFAPLTLNLPATNNPAIAWGDFDNDQLLDFLLIGGSGSSATATLYQNNGTAFTPFTNAVFDQPLFGAVWGDFNNDGYLDLAAARYPGGILVYLNRGTGAFDPPVLSLTSLRYGPILRVADLDGDGDVDLVSVSGMLFRNNYDRPDVPPAAPLGLESSVTGGTAELRWRPSVDAQQVGGLSYQVRVGTGPGKQDIVAAESDLGTGQRRRAALGNAGERTAFLVNSLTPGTYYWSVQAIDNAWQGGAFAAEASFVVGPEVTPFVRLETIAVDPDGTVLLSVSGHGMTELIVESSTNLVDWTPTSTNLFAQPTDSFRLTNSFGKVCFFRVHSRP